MYVYVTYFNRSSDSILIQLQTCRKMKQITAQLSTEKATTVHTTQDRTWKTTTTEKIFLIDKNATKIIVYYNK